MKYSKPNLLIFEFLKIKNRQNLIDLTVSKSCILL